MQQNFQLFHSQEGRAVVPLAPPLGAPLRVGNVSKSIVVFMGLLKTNRFGLMLDPEILIDLSDHFLFSSHIAWNKIYRYIQDIWKKRLVIFY